MRKDIVFYSVIVWYTTCKIL